MALINCSECGAQVSDKAAACPKCGAPPMDATQSDANEAPVVVTEQTSKRLKGQQLLGVGAAVLGVVLINVPGTTHMIGAVLLVGGLAWCVAVRCMIWWHHE